MIPSFYFYFFFFCSKISYILQQCFVNWTESKRNSKDFIKYLTLEIDFQAYVLSQSIFKYSGFHFIATIESFYLLRHWNEINSNPENVRSVLNYCVWLTWVKLNSSTCSVQTVESIHVCGVINRDKWNQSTFEIVCFYLFLFQNIFFLCLFSIIFRDKNTHFNRIKWFARFRGYRLIYLIDLSLIYSI